MIKINPDQTAWKVWSSFTHTWKIRAFSEGGSKGAIKKVPFGKKNAKDNY